MNRYILTDYSAYIDDSVFDYAHHGNIVFWPAVKWTDRAREDIIIFNENLDKDELMKNLHIGDKVSNENKSAIKNLIKKYWDCFCAKGARRTILDYKFAIDTGGSKPVCCGCPKYGPHEKPIIMRHITSLLANGWIEKCEGAWGSMIVLADKSHQEHNADTKKCIWRMCVLYQGLNKVTKPFEYPIPRCDGAIIVFQVGSCLIWIIIIDAYQGYHQVLVCQVYCEKGCLMLVQLLPKPR